ncbi:MAG: hypothetical protein IJP70_03095 [Bacteroidales bacterium]|nr:hypothetical protein [Bacteroidales bacterium]
MPFVVVEPVDDAAGQGHCLDVFLLVLEHADLSFQGDDRGVEPVELPVLAAVEDGYHAVESRHAPFSLSHGAEHGAHFGLRAQGFRFGIVTLLVTHLHQLLRVPQPSRRVLLLSGHIDQHLQHILAHADICFQRVVHEQPLADDPRRVEAHPIGSLEQGIEGLSHKRPAVDAQPEAVGPHLAQVTHDDRRIDNLQRPHGIVVINLHCCLLGVGGVLCLQNLFCFDTFCTACHQSDDESGNEKNTY